MFFDLNKSVLGHLLQIWGSIPGTVFAVFCQIVRLFRETRFASDFDLFLDRAWRQWQGSSRSLNLKILND